MGQQPQINLYIDIVSPFGYLAFQMLRDSPTFSTTTITYTPILLGGLLKTCSNTAPIFIKNKGQWVNRERVRWAKMFKIPVREDEPPVFPVPTVNAMRGVVALQTLAEKGENGVDGQIFLRCVEVLWSALWCPEAKCLEGLSGKEQNGEWNLKDEKTLEVLLASVLGEDLAKKVVGMIGEKEVKDRLAGNTTRAFEKGAFGLPWFECVNSKGEEDGFWGFDHLGQVVKFLELDGDAEKGRSGEVLRAML